MKITRPRQHNDGFSLVELMVGVAIALIAVLAIMEVFSVFEGQKRTTTAGGDAQTTGTIGLYMMERDLRQGGYGLASLSLLGCSARAYNESRTPPEFTLTPIAPITINAPTIPAGDAGTDTVAVTYGSSSGLGGGVPFEQQSGASAEYKVANRAGFQVGEFVIASEPGKDCTIAQITDLPASGSCGAGGGTGQTDIVIHNAGMFRDPEQNCENVPSHWNKPGGLGVTYGQGMLFDMGRLPNAFVYAVRNGNLTVCDMLEQDCADAAKTGDATVWVPVASNIVSLQAQYGRDTSVPMDGSVDLYDKTTPTTPCGWARMPVVRIGLVARSAQYEKGVATTVQPTWAGGTFTINTLPDWNHYRYKTFQTVVPLRNVIWMGAQGSC
jgi:type IV pilus assembly protein PilW